MLKDPPKKTRRQAPGRPAKKAAEPALHARHAKQQEHILRHAAKAFADTGYAVTTMDVLSAATEMNKASLYYYFGSKRDILFELSKVAIADGVQRAQPAPRMKSARDGLAHIIAAGIQTLTAHENESRIFQQEYPYYEQIFSSSQFHELVGLQRQYMKVVYEVLQQGVDTGEFRTIDVRLTGGLFVTWINSSLQFLPTVGSQSIIAALTGLLLPAVSLTTSPN